MQDHIFANHTSFGGHTDINSKTVCKLYMFLITWNGLQIPISTCPQQVLPIHMMGVRVSMPLWH